jgi:hypothetical protein
MSSFFKLMPINVAVTPIIEVSYPPSNRNNVGYFPTEEQNLSEMTDGIPLPALLHDIVLNVLRRFIGTQDSALRRLSGVSIFTCFYARKRTNQPVGLRLLSGFSYLSEHLSRPRLRLHL